MIRGKKSFSKSSRKKGDEDQDIPVSPIDMIKAEWGIVDEADPVSDNQGPVDKSQSNIYAVPPRMEDKGTIPPRYKTRRRG